MAEVDTSSYQHGVKPLNPLEMLGNVANVQNLMNQNKLFNQQYQTNVGLGQIYKEAINPQTGQLDTSKVNALISGNPNVTLALPQAIQNSQEAAQRNIQLDMAKVDQAQKHIQAMANYTSELLALPHPSSNDVASTIGHALSSGLVSQPEAIQFWSNLPRDQAGNIDEGKIPQFLQQQQMQIMSAGERLNAISPPPDAVNTGSQTLFVRRSNFGAPTIAGAIQNTLPPTTQVYNPQTRQMEFAGGGNGGGGQSGAGMAAAPPLGASSAAEVTGQASATQGMALQQMADQVPARKALLGNLEGALDQFTTGPGQNWKQVAKTFANANLPTGMQFDPKSIASQEEFNKQATQLAQSQFQSLGGTGTDAKLDSAMHTSPNDALSKLGNKGIIAMLKGNEDAISVKNQAWQSWLQNHGPESYGAFSTQFNKSYDPRVFQFQYLQPEDRKKSLGGMTKDEQKTFLNSYRTAISNGWVKLPGAQ